MGKTKGRRISEKYACDRGSQARLDGEPREANPYKESIDLQAWWDLGWLEWTDEEVEEYDGKEKGK